MSEQDRLNEIRAWRARMVVPDDLKVERSVAMELIEDGKVAVFQHTLDDYDFLLGMIDDYGLGR